MKKPGIARLFLRSWSDRLALARHPQTRTMQFDRTQVGLIDQSQITQLIRTADTRFSHRLGVKPVSYTHLTLPTSDLV